MENEKEYIFLLIILAMMVSVAGAKTVTFETREGSVRLPQKGWIEVNIIVPDHINDKYAWRAFESPGEEVFVGKACPSKRIGVLKETVTCTWDERLVYGKEDNAIHAFGKGEKTGDPRYRPEMVLGGISMISMTVGVLFFVFVVFFNLESRLVFATVTAIVAIVAVVTSTGFYTFSALAAALAAFSAFVTLNKKCFLFLWLSITWLWLRQ